MAEPGAASYVGDSIVGEQCNLGAGSKTANLVDRGRIHSRALTPGETSLRYNERCQVGINASINVGCSIGSYSVIGPGTVVSGTLLPRSIVM